MFFKTDAERAAAQAAKARQDAGEAGASAASGARNLGAAALATLAEVTAPKDDKSGKRHAQRARAKAMRAAGKDRDSAAKAAGKARERGRSAADHGKKELSRRREKAAQEAGQLAEDARAQGAYAAGVLRDRSSDAAQTVKAKAAPLGERAGEKAGAALMGSLAAAARARAADTRDRAVSGMDHGIDAAVPRAQEGVAAVGPKVDHLRDVINDELLPKIQAMLGDVQTGKDRVLTQDQGIAAAVTGAPKKRSKKGGALIALGLLAAVGAGVAWWLAQQQKAPAADPWATPTTSSDPWASTAPTSVGASATDDAVAADSSSAAGSSAAVTGAGGGTAAISTDAAGAGDAVSSGGPVETPRMLDSEEIDDLGTETPSPIAEQGEGESPAEEIEAARAQEGAPIGDDTSTADGEQDKPRA